MYLIVGLGNPGRKYENTRHNIGFIAIDKLAEKLDIRVNKIKHQALVGEGFVGREKIILAKPQTYMNLSGASVKELISYYKLDITRLIVIYDDIDIDMGTLRIRKKGSGGTHNGMRSIIRILGDDSFPRLRLGIGRNSNIPLDKFVLGNFAKDEIKPMEAVVCKSVDAICTIIEKDLDLAMNRYNG